MERLIPDVFLRSFRRRGLLRVVLLQFIGIALIPTGHVCGQATRVQFIHASPYAEARIIDVYRNGELWLDDFSFIEATPLEAWPDSRQFRLDFVYGSEFDNSNPFYSETVHVTPGGGYYVIAAGDPTRKSDQPPFRLHIQPGATDFPVFPPFPSVEGISLMPDAPRFGRYWRGNDPNAYKGRVSVYESTTSYGEFSGYVTAPGVYFDADERAEMGDSVDPPYPMNLVDETLREKYGGEGGSFFGSFILDFYTKEMKAFINVDAGFLHPPRPADSKRTLVMVLADGTVEKMRQNTGYVQWINNSPYVEAETVDLYINGILVQDDLRYREASSFVEFPSGLQDFSAPTLTVDVIAADATDNTTPLFSASLSLLFDKKYVVVVNGDPHIREGQPPMSLSVYEGWREKSGDSSRVDLLFHHGVPDMVATNIGVEGESLPLVGFVNYGEFAESFSQPVRDDTLHVSHADTRSIAAFAELQLLTRGLSDSALVVLTSGFVHAPEGIASSNSELALVAALPSGGPLVHFVMTPPPSWWQKPMNYVLGLFVLGVLVLAGNQTRILRLRARERELSGLVEERTRELVVEKQKTEAQAERLLELDEAKNRFFTNISHEFRTPLTLIIGPIQDAIDGAFGSMDVKFQKQLRLMRRNSRRLLRLVNQLLDLSRLESGKMEIYKESGDLKSFVHNLTGSFVPLAERKDITLTFESDVERQLVDFDPDALEKVVSNLLSNALKFTPDRGDVIVSLKMPEEAMAEINVVDTGPGIDARDLALIFERFQQGDTSIRRSHEGTGIGLSLARELTVLHGGDLQVESELGSGSRFIVRIPVPDRIDQPSEAQAITAERQEDEDSKFHDELLIASEKDESVDADKDDEKRATILIVEDNADVRSYIRSHFEDHYDLLEADDGEKGLQMAQGGDADLILADVMMPNMDGYEMCRLIKANEKLRHIPVIMLTAKATSTETLEGLGSGADDYITKPFKMPELLAKVENLIATRREMRARFSREILVRPADITISPEEEVFLDRIIEAVNHHIGDSNFSTDWLADEVGLSRRQLDRRVLAVTGETASELTRRMRMERASQLLRARVGTVSEVAYAVGFRSPAHFSRVFRQAFGMAPSDLTTGDSVPNPVD